MEKGDEDGKDEDEERKMTCGEIMEMKGEGYKQEINKIAEEEGLVSCDDEPDILKRI